MSAHPRLVGGLVAAGLILAVSAGSGAALAGAQHSARPAAMLNSAPRNWRVIAGFTQVLPGKNGNTEAVNQFYPRVRTIYAGDSVTWTDNSTSEAHTVTFGPDPLLRKLENPQNQIVPQAVSGKQILTLSPAVFLPSAPGPLVETDAGSAKTVLNCGLIGPVGAPGAQSCTVTFPNPGTYSYDCLLHSGIPGNADMDGKIVVLPRPAPQNKTWTVWAGTGTATDANNGFFPPDLTIRAGDSVSWKSGGVLFHTVSFGLDPRKIPLAIPVGKDAHGAPILEVNPAITTPVIPAGGVYTGGVANSGVGLTGNYAALPGQTFIKAPFVLTFSKPGVYRYYCLIHPGMAGVIRVVAAGAS